MPNLPSGLPEQISDDEYLARFLTQSKWFNTACVKPVAFLPYKGETSVFRHGPKPVGDLWKIANDQDLPKVHGVAIITAQDVRESGLDVFSDELPMRHAAIRNWPTSNDSAFQKSQQLDLALKLAEAAGKAMLKDK
jgi:hypothetical protein